MLQIKLYELVFGKYTLLFTQKDLAVEEKEEVGVGYTFPKFELPSDIFKSETPIADKTLIIEILECDKKNNAKTKLMAKT